MDKNRIEGGGEMMTDDNEEKLYGFIINGSIQLDIANRRLSRFYSPTEKSVLFAYVMLNKTTLQLLIYLLKNACRQEISSKEDILRHLWDEQEDFSSNQRLWQVMKELKLKLRAIELPSDFIVSIKGRGYSVKDCSIVALFYK
jgi:DNA-binding winged helix-turn-helix (wHTH) protein